MINLFKALLIVLYMSFGAKARSIELTPHNTLVYFGDVHFMGALQLIAGYEQIRKETAEDIYLVIHSPGGEVESAVVIMNALKADKKLHVIVIFAASAAACISQNVGGNVYIVPNGEMMFHEVRYIFTRPVVETYLRESLEALTRANNGFAKFCNVRMKHAHYRKMIKTDWWLKAHEAVKVNAADSVNSFTCSKELLDIKANVPLFHPLHGMPSFIHFCHLLK